MASQALYQCPERNELPVSRYNMPSNKIQITASGDQNENALLAPCFS
jgi:hypothetical protein